MSYGPYTTLTDEQTQPTRTLGGFLAFLLAFPLFIALLAAPAIVIAAGLGAVTAYAIARRRDR